MPLFGGVCTVCQRVTNGGPRCDDHPRRQAKAIYRDPRWKKARAQAIAAHVRAYGWTCPGWRRPAHPSTRLSGDHRVPITRGGAPYDPANIDVLCVDCNRRKGAS